MKVELKCPDCNETRATEAGVRQHWHLKHSPNKSKYLQLNLKQPGKQNYASQYIVK